MDVAGNYIHPAFHCITTGSFCYSSFVLSIIQKKIQNNANYTNNTNLRLLQNYYLKHCYVLLW